MSNRRNKAPTDFTTRRQRSQSADPVRRQRSESFSPGKMFQRSRTITGSTSSSILTAGNKRTLLSSKRLKAQNLRKYRAILASAALISWAMVGGAIWMLDQYIGEQTIFTPSIVKNTPLPAEISALNDSYFSNRPFERFRFAVDAEQNLLVLQSEIPEIESITYKNGKGLLAADIEVALREPVAKWTLGSTTYYVDKNGQAFERNHYDEPAVSVDDQSGLPPTEQRRLASRQLLFFIGQLVAAVNAPNSSYGVETVIIPPGTLKQVDVRLTDPKTRIKLSTERGAGAQVRDAVNALEYIEGEGESAEYIDVRIAGKAYYR